MPHGCVFAVVDTLGHDPFWGATWTGELSMPKILLVEDNEMNINMLSRRLQKRGYSVVSALDGRQGYLLARSESPDLILMDISLPAMDGWELTRLLKSSVRPLVTSPIIALTAHALVTDREKAPRGWM